MLHRYLARTALTSVLFALLPAAIFAHPIAHSHRTHRERADTPQSPLDTLYSRRALRRARIILQLKLLELREMRLERVRKAIERGIPIDELIDGGDDTKERPRCRSV